MPIDADKLKRVLTRLIGELKTNALELEAHRTIFLGMNHEHPDAKLEEQLKNLCSNALLRRSVHAKYDARLEMLLKSIDQAVADQDLDRLLQDWLRERPETPPS